MQIFILIFCLFHFDKFSIMLLMRKRYAVFAAFFCIHAAAWGTTRDAQLTNTTGYNYNYMYPYMNNQMRTNLNPGVTTSQSTSPINAVVRTTKMAADRRVVPRPTNGRSATNTTTRRIAATMPNSNPQVARAATPGPGATSQPAARPRNTNRRVVARSGIRQNARVRNAGRGDLSYTGRAVAGSANYAQTDTERVSSVRCLADYTQCMNGYCERKNTAYNKCYCSSKLSQIDAQYQNAIDDLIKQILTIQGTNKWSDAEMNEYWMDTVGKYTGTDNSWTKLDSALNIDWAGMESRVRGQSAFNTGHEYCVQHLRGCSYMSANLRDAYRSEIARDCATYEQSLQRLKNAAESIIEANK